MNPLWRGVLVGLGLELAGVLAGWGVSHAWAQELPDETLRAAEAAGVDATDLQGASNTTGLGPFQYLYAVSELARPVSCDLPICGALGARLYCIEGYESRHTGSAVNPSSGAAGWLQWLPSTARQWGVIVGNRASEWAAAARVAALGERFLVSQWVVLQRGLC